MSPINQRRAVYAVLLAGMLVFLNETGASEKDHGHGHGGRSQGKNPLIEEMHILDNAFREVVSAVSIGDGSRVHRALHAMHGTMEKTHEAVHHGDVKIPRNADQAATFVQMDKDFHEKLEKLAVAGKKNNQQEMLFLTKALLDGCVQCHSRFR